jgi:fibronectin-binding autotransporter adhesin
MAVKGLPTAAESSHFDANQVPSIVAVQGTLGTSDVTGSAPTVPLSANPLTGALYVQDLSGATGTTNITGTVANTGTNVNVVTGTINSLPQISVGTIPQVSVGTIPQVSVGTIPNMNIATGTQQTLGTVANLNNGSVNILTGTLQSSGTTTGVGVVSALTNGSVNILTGTIQNFGAGTISTGTLQNLVTGTINALAAGTITTGTIGGKAASGAAAVANPVQIAGTDSGGTVYSPLVSTAGVLTTNLTSSGTVLNLATGTLANSGTTTGVGVVSALTTGSVTLTGGTLTLGTLTNLVSGTINAIAAGTITTGTVSVTTGTIGGKAASGAAAVANPVQIAGTDGGGTVYSPLVSTAGVLTTNLTSSGTLLNLAAGTLTAVTTVTTVSNLTNGSVNILTGTVTSVGTSVGVGTVSNIGSVNTVTTLGQFPASAAITDGITSPTVTKIQNFNMVWDSVGTQWQRVQSANSARDAVGSGLLGAGILAWDGAAWRPITAYAPGDTDSNDSALESMARNQIWNGASWARMKVGTAATNTTGLGLSGAAILGQDSGGTMHLLATTTGGNIGTLLTIRAGLTGTYISAAGTTTVKSSAGILHRIVIGSLLGGGTLYNSAGTSTAIIWSTITPPVNSYEFNLGFGSLTWAGTGAQNISIIYS